MERFKAIVGIVSLLLLGFLSGIAVTMRWLQPPPLPQGPDWIISFLDKEIQPVLDLNPDQQVQFRETVKTAHHQLVSVFSEFKPRTDEILAETHDRLRTILNDDQREKFNQLLAKREENRPPPPPKSKQ